MPKTTSTNASNGCLPQPVVPESLELAGRFSTSLLHELSTPLQAILSNIEAARCTLRGAQPPDVEALRRLTADVHASARRAADTVAQLHAFITRGAAQHEALDINVLVEKASTFLRSDFLRRGLSVKMDLASGMPTLRGDRRGIEQVVLTLLLDAADSAREVAHGALLMIKTYVAGSDLRIVAHAAAAGELQMPGLDANEGMERWNSLSSHIVQAHGGRAWAQRGLHGTDFVVALPVAKRVRRPKTSPAHRVRRRTSAPSDGRFVSRRQEGTAPQPASTMSEVRVEIARVRLRTAATFVSMAEKATDTESVEPESAFQPPRQACLPFADPITAVAEPQGAD